MDEKVLSELQSLVKEIPASSIPLVKEITPTQNTISDINAPGQIFWGNKSNQLLNDYNYGKALALFGKNELTVSIFFKRFAMALCAIITNEYQKRGFSTEQIKSHYNILESCMNLLSKEIEKKDLKDLNVYSIISALHGFIVNYDQQKEIK